MMLKDGVAVTWLRDNNGGRHLPTSVIYLFERTKKARGIFLSLVNVVTIWNCIGFFYELLLSNFNKLMIIHLKSLTVLQKLDND